MLGSLGGEDGLAGVTEGLSPRYMIRAAEVAWREVGDEVVVLYLTTATYLSINGSGRLLWLALVDGASSHELTAILSEEYGLPEDQVAGDVQVFLDNLQELGLLIEVSE